MITSWDFFDTLFGRWYKEPKSIFQEMESVSGIADFAQKRQFAEHKLYKNAQDARLNQIYTNFAMVYPELESKIQELTALELETELKMSFPILENTRRVQKEDIIVSDMYLPADFLSKIMEKHSVGPVSEIFSVSGGKTSGKIWPIVRKTHQIYQHIGDNPQADFELAKRYGVRGNLYVEKHVETEQVLTNMGFGRIANLSRVLRLTNPYVDAPNSLVWNEQATLNIPILLLTALYVPFIYHGKRVLMMTRDCNNLLNLFPLVNPDMQVEEFYSSRKCLRTASESYKDYVRWKLGTDDPLVVDLHGRGISKDNFYAKFGHAPKEFYIIQSSLDDKPYRKYIVHRSIERMWESGFLWEIENANLDTVGSIVDVVDGKPVRAPLRYNPELVEIQHMAVDAARKLLANDFDIKFPGHLQKDIADAIIYLLKQLHNTGAAVTKLGIPDINDWGQIE